ncbi:MAG TPA: PAS domain-containing protein [Rhizomicrobium sp.]|nr:PAS domain-containing protein [Rhizomicrobium sp.]
MSYAAPPAQQRPVLDPTLAPLILDWDLQFTRQPTQRACAYWHTLCGDRKMPRRQELSPSGMREFLANVNLIEVISSSAEAAPDFRVSLQGQHGTEVYGQVMNRPLEEVLPAHVVKRWRETFLTCFRAVRPVRFCSKMLIGGRAWLEGEALLAPLGDAETGVQALFVAFVSWQAENFGAVNHQV